MPLSEGICSKNASSASNPPADAPIPTMGKRSDADSVRGPVGWARVRAAGSRLAGRRARSFVAVPFGVLWGFDGFCLASMCFQLLPGRHCCWMGNKFMSEKLILLLYDSGLIL